MFKEISNFSYPSIEEEILSLWEKEMLFQKSIENRSGNKNYIFYEGPPTANGKPGIHHVMARTIKDIFCRYKTLKGYMVERKGGWDTHGLPVEIEIEKKLGLTSNRDIEQYGIENFNKVCQKSVLSYKDIWHKLTNRIGYWIDLDNPYITFNNDYIESVWWALKELYKKQLLYQDYKIHWYSPGSETVLSSHEVSLGYRNVNDPSIIVKFPCNQNANTYYLAWTTTPWTLPSNMALAVHPKIEYVHIAHKDDNEISYYFLAKNILNTLFSDNYEIVKTMQGAELIQKQYRPLFNYAKKNVDSKHAWTILSGDFVSDNEGTGIVHMAPAFGQEDNVICKQYNIPIYNPISKDGRFSEKTPPYQGLWFKDADKIIIKDIKKQGLLFKQSTINHKYPYDWRKNTPLMNYPINSWFIRTTAFKESLIDINKTINWYPNSTGTGRFGDWLKNNTDWAISRQRYWGTPLPIWINENDPIDIACIGSIAELKKKSKVSEEKLKDVHRPYIDRITWEGKDGGIMRRVPDLIDVWFDSGAMPFAQWHYPFENKKKFEQNFPADFISEGVDQTRGWFYTLHAISTLLFGKKCFKNVISTGLILDKNGEKMSKSKKNTIEPFQLINQYGVDGLRWYMITNSQPWDNLRFDTKQIKKIQQKIFSTLINTYSFFALYANIDNYTAKENMIPPKDRLEIDQWILSRLHSLVAQVDDSYNNYNPTKATRLIETFIDEMSNWYVRRNRKRFWKENLTLDKLAAYQTLHQCLRWVSILISPITPFISDWLYRQLIVSDNIPHSVHLTQFPKSDSKLQCVELEDKMALARRIASLALRIRNTKKINVRQPLPKLLVSITKKEWHSHILAIKKLILEEVNVKKLEIIENSYQVTSYSIKPNYRILGKKFGKDIHKIISMIATMDKESIHKFKEKGSILLSDSSLTYNLQSEDAYIMQHDLHGYASEHDNDLLVAFEIDITPELHAEGIARELINRIQNMRREAQFQVTDKIIIEIKVDHSIQDILYSQLDHIKRETMAIKINYTPTPKGNINQEWAIDKYIYHIALSNVKI